MTQEIRTTNKVLLASLLAWEAITPEEVVALGQWNDNVRILDEDTIGPFLNGRTVEDLQKLFDRADAEVKALEEFGILGIEDFRKLYSRAEEIRNGKSL